MGSTHRTQPDPPDSTTSAGRILIVVLSLIGCGGPASSASGPQAPAAAEATPAPAEPAPDEVAPEVAPADEMLARLQPLVGTWVGDTSGEPGNGKVERTYRFALRGRFLEARNRTVYPPTERKPDGEVHEDLGFYSHDRGRKTIVLRQFHVEGFVSQYVLERSDGGAFVFVSESIENIPPGFRARETLRLAGDRLEETFELAPPGKEFSVYSSSTMTRSGQHGTDSGR